MKTALSGLFRIGKARIGGAATVLGRTQSGSSICNAMRFNTQHGIRALSTQPSNIPPYQWRPDSPVDSAQHSILNSVPKLSGLPRQIVHRVLPGHEATMNLLRWIKAHGGYVHPGLWIGNLAYWPSATPAQLTSGQSIHDIAVTPTILNSRDDGNWGIRAVVPIPEGEQVIAYSHDLCLTPYVQPEKDQGRMTPQRAGIYQSLALIMSTLPQTSWQVRLGVRLLSERASDDSFYRAYIDALPGIFPTHPLFFAEKAVNALQNQTTKDQLSSLARVLHTLAKRFQDPSVYSQTDQDEQTRQQQQQQANHWNPLRRARHVAFNGYDVGVADLAWAVAAVSSRAFNTPVPVVTFSDAQVGIGSESQRESEAFSAHKALLPLIDICNHSYTPNCKVIFRKIRQSDASSSEKHQYQVVLRALRPIAAGEELTISYFEPDGRVLRAAEQAANADPQAAESKEFHEARLTKRTYNMLLEWDRKTTNPTLGPPSLPFYFAEAFTRARTRALGMSSPSLQPWEHPASNSALFLPALYGYSGDVDGSKSGRVSNDDILLNFGFVPEFNPDDSVYIPVSDDFLEHSLQIASELPSLLAKAKDPQNPKREDTDQARVTFPVIPQFKQLLPAQLSLLDLVRNSAPPSAFYVTWNGPSLWLLALLRIATSGAHVPSAYTQFYSAADLAALEKSLPDPSDDSEPFAPSPLAISQSFELVRSRLGDHLELSKQLALIGQRSPLIYASAGRPASEAGDEYDPLTAQDIVKAWGTPAISHVANHANGLTNQELPATLLLFAQLSLMSSGSPTTISQDKTSLEEALKQGDAATATAIRFAISKKLLMSFAFRTVADRLGSGIQNFPIFKRMD